MSFMARDIFPLAMQMADGMVLGLGTIFLFSLSSRVLYTNLGCVHYCVLYNVDIRSTYIHIEYCSDIRWYV
jgi:hypothetical protein